MYKDSDFTQKLGKTYYGYKLYIAIDEVIKFLEFTNESEYNSKKILFKNDPLYR
jgi:hypothetical protein